MESAALKPAAGKEPSTGAEPAALEPAAGEEPAAGMEPAALDPAAGKEPAGTSGSIPQRHRADWGQSLLH
jgi:hypothetical protein